MVTLTSAILHEVILFPVQAGTKKSGKKSVRLKLLDLIAL